ncbi:MAG: dicarboxylate/amino acid:cation symporter [Methanoregulaceae archaeon]|nr:dicarboxylate/amino acid:cation symporter [Methanoregulaceae archaeon]
MSERRARLPLHTQVMIGLVLGAIAGLIGSATLEPKLLKEIGDNYAKPIGNIFIYGIFMVVVPLLFSALALGIAELGDIRKVGRIGVRALLMTVLLSGIAVLLGLAAINIFNPADQLSTEQKSQLVASYGNQEEAAKRIEAAQAAKADDPPLFGFIPRNPVKEAGRALEGGLLPLMFFSLVFGIALSMIEGEKALPMKQFLEGLFAVSLKMIDLAMKLAPIGVFALIFFAASQLGADLLKALGLYVVLVVGVLAFHLFVVYSLTIKFIAKRNPREFFSQMRTVMLTAFATSSSNATLPAALRAAEEDLGLPRRISSFVLTVGATANQNGTALFEGIAIIFLSSMFGVTLDLGQQFTVMLLAIVAGIGTAGVPGGSLPLIGLILTRFGVPAEAIGLIMGVDRICDMSRTVLNVTGDMTIAACVTAMEPKDPADVAPADD